MDSPLSLMLRLTGLGGRRWDSKAAIVPKARDTSSGTENAVRSCAVFLIASGKLSDTGGRLCSWCTRTHFSAKSTKANQSHLQATGPFLA